MAICNKCFNEFPDKRKNLGYKICIECGDKKAQIEINKKSNYIAPLYNKGSYQYIGTIDTLKNI